MGVDVLTLMRVFVDEISEIGALMDMIVGRPAWHRDAACKEAPPEVTWFGEPGHDPQLAKTVCDRCLVEVECLAWALTQGPELPGTWGGLDATERKTLSRRRASA